MLPGWVRSLRNRLGRSAPNVKADGAANICFSSSVSRHKSACATSGTPTILQIYLMKWLSSLGLGVSRHFGITVLRHSGFTDLNVLPRNAEVPLNRNPAPGSIFANAMIAPLLATVLMSQSVQFSSLVRVPLSPQFGSEISVVESESTRPGMDWDEAIVSWNVSNLDQAWLKIEAQGVWPDKVSRWYVLADWTGDLAKGPRASIPGQKDADGEVQTDLLKLYRSCPEMRLRVSSRKVGVGPEPNLKLLAVSFSNSKAPSPEPNSDRTAFGKVIEVPRLAQGPYEFGKLAYDPNKVSATFKDWFGKVKEAQYCSPTCVSMVASHWGAKLKRMDLMATVPQVVAGVYDEKYPGTGNWPFNTAYLGSFEGMRSYVTRLNSLADLETLIAKGIPVVCSVSSNLLKGKPAGGDGHLVVLVGFEKNGDPVFNDPGKTDQIRRTYKRADFTKAWNQSKRTVYICHPESLKLPKLLGPSVLLD